MPSFETVTLNQLYGEDEIARGAYDPQEESYPDQIVLEGVGVSGYRNDNDETFEKIAERLDGEIDGTVDYRPVADIDNGRDDLVVKDVFDTDSYDEHTLLMVPDAAGFQFPGKNYAERYSEFLDLTATDEVDGIMFLNVEDDLEKRGANGNDTPTEPLHHTNQLAAQLETMYGPDRITYRNLDWGDNGVIMVARLEEPRKLGHQTSSYEGAERTA